MEKRETGETPLEMLSRGKNVENAFLDHKSFQHHFCGKCGKLTVENSHSCPIFGKNGENEREVFHSFHISAVENSKTGKLCDLHKKPRKW
ncbi:MAG: hypothetical protein J6W28_03295 [Clostridia bacterium]|nr:hypothetical protein [Clostridia bacterium]